MNGADNHKAATAGPRAWASGIPFLEAAVVTDGEISGGGRRILQITASLTDPRCTVNLSDALTALVNTTSTQRLARSATPRASWAAAMT